MYGNIIMCSLERPALKILKLVLSIKSTNWLNPIGLMKALDKEL